jgi:urease accessory protein
MVASNIGIQLVPNTLASFGLEYPQAQIEKYNLYLRLGCDREQQTFVARQYTTYPFRLSRTFRLDQSNSSRAYLYIMNVSPGVLAGDKLYVSIQVEANARAYLTDQSATKVHSMPISGATAETTYNIKIGAEANLELVPEPLILYKEASYKQVTEVLLHSTSHLFLSEIIVPGRLARSEYYKFNYYLNRLRVFSIEGELIFGDTMRLDGKLSLFKDSFFFLKYPIMATAIAIIPNTDLNNLSKKLDTLVSTYSSKLFLGYSRLPNCEGLFIRVMGTDISSVKVCIQCVLSYIRQISNQPPLPEIPK